MGCGSRKPATQQPPDPPPKVQGTAKTSLFRLITTGPGADAYVREDMMMLNKSQLIDAIRDLNSSADRAWLGLFTRDELERYLQHLQHAQQPRGESPWQRTSETQAIMVRHAA